MKLNINFPLKFLLGIKSLEKDILGLKKDKMRLLLITAPIPFVLALVLVLAKIQSTLIIATFSLSFIGVLIPYMVYGFLEFKEIQLAEEGYPNFLRDLAQSVSSGMTIPHALQTASHAKYGVMSKYVNKLNTWVSFGVPFPEAWQRFTNSLQKSDLIRRINGVVLEAFVAGGDLGAVLSSLASDVILLKRMEADKKSMAQQHIVIMYVIFFIFLGIIIGLYKILIPILYIQRVGVFSGVALRPAEEITVDYFKNLFFLMTLVLSACAGFISGQISEERLAAGIKHILAMIAIGVFTFFVFIYPAKLATEVTVFPENPGIGQDIIVSGRVTFESAGAAGTSIEIVGPSREIQQLFADSQGEFTTMFKAPTQPGPYSILVNVNYRSETQSVTKWVTVGA